MVEVAAGTRRVRGPSPTKQRAILIAAREVFIEAGFGGASLDEIASRAEVSRQTVYTHFTDKEHLFARMVETEVGRGHEPGHPLDLVLGDSDDFTHDLHRYARDHLALVMRPDLIAVRRMLLGEAGRFPALAEVWYREGPERSCRTFARWFERLDERGLLHVPDSSLAAEQFNWLVLSIPLNRAMSGLLKPPRFNAQELDRHADDGVRTFLRAYRRH